jgi:serine phosphatase RsbU (regulator of sigma subunit)
MEKLEYANNLYYSNPDSSYLVCNAIAEKLNGKKYNEYAEAVLCKARYFILKTRFDEAAALLNEASEIFKSEKNLSRLAKCHSLKSILLGRISDPEKALFHQRKALGLYIVADDKKGQIDALTNISLDFLETQQNDSAFYYLLKLKTFKDEMTESSIYYFHQNFATYFYNVKNYQSSIDEYEKALSIAEKLNMIDSKATVFMLIAKTNIAEKKYNLAKRSLNKSITIATDNKLLHEANEAYNMLIELHEILGDYKQAFEIKKINDKIEKEIYNLEKINKINEIEGQLKLTEKEKIITQKELELKSEQLNTVKAESRITQLFFVVAFSIIIIIFIAIILLRARKLNRKISAQKMMLEQKNSEITDSITYAKRIQSAILPASDYFKKHLPNSFILYQPKDIVAGDFYWMQIINDTVLYAAADCTGHGVPGAMVSVVCSNSLNQSVKELKTTNPSEIMEMTRGLIKESLDSTEDNVVDGMDIALCSLNLKTNEVIFSGANNPLYIVRNGELTEIKGDKQPVGKYFQEKPYNNHSYQLQKGDTIYTFTDGFADQFGGPKGKKFMYKQFKQLIISIVDKNVEEQKEMLTQTFENWKGDLDQIDDVCVIGVQI